MDDAMELGADRASSVSRGNVLWTSVPGVDPQLSDTASNFLLQVVGDFGENIISRSGAELAASFTALVALCHGASSASGWHQHLKTGQPFTEEEQDAKFAERIALGHSELSEALEGHRKGLADDKLPHRPMAEVELADAVIRIADLAGAMRYDLAGAIVEKIAYNLQRQDHKRESRLAAGGKAY